MTASKNLVKQLLEISSLTGHKCVAYGGDEGVVMNFVNQVLSFETSVPVAPNFHEIIKSYHVLLTSTGKFLNGLYRKTTESKNKVLNEKYIDAAYKCAFISTRVLINVYQRAADSHLIEKNKFEIFKQRVSARQKSVSEVYIEDQVFNNLGEICKSISGEGNRNKIDACESRTNFYLIKNKIDTAVASNSLTPEHVEEFLVTLESFTSIWLDVIFKNFIKFYINIGYIQKFFDQQIQLKLQYIHTKNKMEYEKLKNVELNIRF